MSYRDELIQCAAVCIAALQDHFEGTTVLHCNNSELDKTQVSIFEAISDERLRQEGKWGARHHTPEKWFVILGEEVGEVGRAILEKDMN